MIKSHNLGFPRIGKNRELKFKLESYWKGEISELDLRQFAKELRLNNLKLQSNLDFIQVGDFSLYDQVLDMSFTLGNIPIRSVVEGDTYLESYFKLARGQSNQVKACHCVSAGEMTKWFDTNYHYIVPELYEETSFKLNFETYLEQINEAKKFGNIIKPIVIGPLTYLHLSKTKNESIKSKLDFLEPLILVYQELFQEFKNRGIEWVQIDEPILAIDLESEWKDAFIDTYDRLYDSELKLLLTTYFGELRENLDWINNIKVDGIHLDAVRAFGEVDLLINKLDSKKIISLGIIDGRNVWKTDLNKTIQWLKPIAQKFKHRLWLAPSCSLIHSPVDLSSELKLDSEIKGWLAFATQKIQELEIICKALNEGEASVSNQLEQNAQAIESRNHSKRVHRTEVKKIVENLGAINLERQNNYEVRQVIQKEILNLPLFPTTSIGSFPQTKEIRATRLKYKKGQISYEEYQNEIKAEIALAIKYQEEIGLDVLVHGEAERNDMVEYFGEQLNGYVFSQMGWVQSYGSRCVKPPIIYGDIFRPKAMTIDWINYAQSLSHKPVKGMLTGPVTILNWSFVRDDQPRSLTCKQIALAIRDEVLDLEKVNVKIIQIDEAALREGLPLRKSDWQEYLGWAIDAFKLSANGVKDQTQIHTHMCYSSFNDIIKNIADMDADVITIETSRSDMVLLEAFKNFKYPNQMGPGVYDIHSPNIPTVEQMIDLLEKAAVHIPPGRLWVNPDCGLKTRQWTEVIPALENMIKAAKILRAKKD